MSEKQQNYLEVVANAFKTAQAWRSASFLLAALVVVLLYANVSQSRSTSTVLVPYEVALAGQPMKVNTSGEIRGTNHEYIANVAMADLGLILNFTPDNVITQHQRFLNRLTEHLHGEQRENLLAQAEDYKRRSVTQAFFPLEVRVMGDGSRAEVTGTQIRYLGGKETLRNRVTYVISYKVHKGYMHVSDLRQSSRSSK